MAGREADRPSLLIGLALALLVAVAILAFIGPLLFVRVAGGNHYKIPSYSMSPTLMPGDWVLGLPVPGKVERGSVVSYRARSGTIYISRVIGLSGETVQIKGGVVWIGGEPASMERLPDRVIPMLMEGQPPFPPRCTNMPVGLGSDCIQEQWRETLPDGTTEVVLNLDGEIGKPFDGSSYADDTPAYIVLEGHLFFLGDNRDNSVDSRFAERGMIPRDHVLNRVWMIHSSLDRAGGHFWPRLGRFFTVVR